MAVNHSNILADWRVVVADDEQFSRAIVIRMIRDLGCRDALTASTGQEAIHHLQASTAHKTLLLSDFNMPGIDGLSLSKLIRTGKVGPNDLPIIMLTGHADSNLVSAALALDVDSFVIKPVSVVQLANRLSRVLGEKREIGPPAAYAKIDVETIRQKIMRHEPVGLLRTSQPARKDVTLIKLKLKDVKEGHILGEEIRAPTGERLLKAGVVLSQRYLQRLNDLSSVINLEYLTVVEADVKSPS